MAPSDNAEESRITAKSPATDERFQRFYSTFEGLISKISAPLGFAGLPLGTEDAPTSRKSPAETKLDRHHATPDRGSALAQPDVNRLFSRAALRSIRDTPGSFPANTAESFYVVPTTGGTMSYAGILTRAEKEVRRNSLEEVEEDFVDARETPSSPEVRQSSGNIRAGRRGTADKFKNPQNPKTLEELQMENLALKQLSDTLSKRLHMWEVNAQSSSMALQQSLRAMHHHKSGPADQSIPGSGSTSPVATLTTAPAAPQTDLRIKELEELLRRDEQELERVGRENDKLKNVLGRYRDRWEKLKEGAKTRRAEGRSTEGQSNPSTPVLSNQRPDLPTSPQPNDESPSKPVSGNVSDTEAEGNTSAVSA